MSTGARKEPKFLFLDPKLFSETDVAWFRWQLRDSDTVIITQAEGTWLATQRRANPMNGHKLPNRRPGSFMMGWWYFMGRMKGYDEATSRRDAEVNKILTQFPHMIPPPNPGIAVRR